MNNISIADIRRELHEADIAEAAIDAEMAKLTPEQIAAGQKGILDEAYTTIYRLKKLIDAITI